MTRKRQRKLDTERQQDLVTQALLSDDLRVAAEAVVRDKMYEALGAPQNGPYEVFIGSFGPKGKRCKPVKVGTCTEFTFTPNADREG